MEKYTTIRTLLGENRNSLKLKLVCSENGLNRKVTVPDLHRPGLALSGFVELFSADRIQILGNTEISYLSSLSEHNLQKSIDRYIEFEIPAIIVTNDNPIPEYLIQTATRRYISIMQTPLSTTHFVHLLGEYLETKFAPTISMHGSLVDIYGIGILLTGQSGIGKSEIALDLVERGHRLVADDMVIVKQISEGILMGRGKEISEFLLEVRGVGLVDIRRIFGIRGVRKRKRIEVEVNLVPWEVGKTYERVGLEDTFNEILGVKIPQVTLPINPGKNVTVIAETISMHYLLKMYGYHTAKQFNDRLKNFMKHKDLIPYHKDQSYFEKDWE